VAGDISRDTGNPGVRFVQADFAQLAQVRRLAHELQSQLPRLDVLIKQCRGDGRRARAQRGRLRPDLLRSIIWRRSCSPICCWTSLRSPRRRA